MSFHWPHLFWLLVVPAVLLMLEARRGRLRTHPNARPKIGRAEAGLHDLQLTSAPSSAPAYAKRQIRWRLHLGLALVIVSLARPQWGKLEEPVFDQAREIIIALDLSRSMLATDVRPSRLDRAKLLVTSLLERLAGERVGLIVFAGTAFLQSPLSSDYEILNEFLPNLTPDYLPQGGSNYRALIDDALAAFGASGSADRFLIVLSDGEATEETWKVAAQELKEKGIRVVALGIGTPAGSIIPDSNNGYVKDERGAVVLSKLQPATLQELSTLTGGVYVDASSWVDLAQLLQSTVESGRAGEFKEQRAARLMERFQWVLAPGLILLFWSLCSEFPVHPRAREVKLRPQPQTPGAAKGAAAALAVALAVLSAAVESPAAAPAPDADGTAAAPLSKLVADFAARPKLSARDYAELARSTVTYGERTLAAQQPVAEGAIRDGLSAVDAGEAAEPKGAEWEELREKLEQLLEKPESPPQEQPQDEQDKQDQKDQQKQKDQEKQEKEQRDPESQDEKSKGSDDEAKDNEKSEPSPQDPSQPDDKPGDPTDEQREEQPPQSAFGDMEQPPAPTPPPPKPSQGETQKVGGSPEQKKSQTPADPALVVPLQKLEQVKNQDAPVRLQQLMRGEQETPPQTGKNW